MLRFDLHTHRIRPGVPVLEVRDATTGILRATVTVGDTDNDLRLLSTDLATVLVLKGRGEDPDLVQVQLEPV